MRQRTLLSPTKLDEIQKSKKKADWSNIKELIKQHPTRSAAALAVDEGGRTPLFMALGVGKDVETAEFMIKVCPDAIKQKMNVSFRQVSFKKMNACAYDARLVVSSCWYSSR